MGQLTQAYQKAFLSQNADWVTPGLVIFMIAIAISAAFLYEYVLEPKYLKNYHLKHQAFPSPKEMMWFRMGYFCTFLVVMACYMLLINWP